MLIPDRRLTTHVTLLLRLRAALCGALVTVVGLSACRDMTEPDAAPAHAATGVAKDAGAEQSTPPIATADVPAAANRPDSSTVPSGGDKGFWW